MQERSVLGLFPTIDPESIGGVQASGRIAWEGIERGVQAEDGFARLFCYRNSAGRRGGSVLHHFDRLAAILRALAWRQPCNQILIWHIDLLQLLRFFRLPSARVILFLHGVEAWHKPDALSRVLLNKVNLFLSNSTHTWQVFLHHHPWLSAVSHEVVHLGIASPSAPRDSVPDKRPTALMLGRMVRSEDYKGHREMIAAWPRVLARIPEAQLWIAGAGDLRRDLERLVEARGFRDSVVFWGEVSETEKKRLLLQCSCLALPSRAEGFGLVYLEAMRLGRPCLVSTLDAGREVVNPPEAGLAANPGNAQAVADAVCRLLMPGAEWNTWSAQARRRYDTQFTAEHFQNRLVSAVLS